MRNSAWRGIVNWQTNRSNCTKFQRLAWMFITSRKRSWKPSEICPMFLKCLYLARIGRPDILWSVNKLARAVTKWTNACDRRSARLISKIHHTNDCRQYCRVGVQLNTADSACSKTPILLRTRRIQKLVQGIFDVFSEG